jgi:ATP-dependent helicase/nuclease subunit A
MSAPSSTSNDAPASMQPDLSDDEWRRRIGPWAEGDLEPLSDFRPNTNFVVRAAAGSGKTTALVARMVALIRQGEAEIDDLAAITFTRKAAGEMKERLYRELLSARAVLAGSRGEYEGSEDERRRVEQALSRVEQCFVGTVHSFCGRILREHALEAGLPPDFAAGIDERDEADLRSRVWDRYVAELHRSGDGALERLREAGLRPDDLTGLYATVSAHPELDAYTQPPASMPDLGEAVEEARRFVDTWQARRPDPPREDRGDAQKALDRAEGMLRHRSLEHPADQARLLEVLEGGHKGSTEKGDVTLKAWGEKGGERYEQAGTLKHEAYPDFAQRVLNPALDAWRAHAHDRAVGFVRPAAERYLEARRREGQLTHHDVLYHTRNLLRDDPEVRRRAHERFPRLLVDEFQDTDPLQAEILFYLTSTDREERAWSACTPRPGSLFIVGDDKQSIYRFRRADIATFKAVVGRMQEAGGQVATLTRNFRSSPGICDLADRAFSEAFADPDHEDVQADYTAFEPHQDPGRDESAVRRLQVGYEKRNPGGAIARKTADQVAGFIHEALDAGADHPMAGPPGANPVFEGSASPEDFLILTGGKSHLSAYGRALARAGIPFSITGSDDLGDSEDLKAFVDLLTCALRPGDEVAAIAYLRGSLCGLSDDDLYRIRRAFDDMEAVPFRFAQEGVPDEALSGLGDALAERLETAAGQVRQARRQVRSRRPALALPAIAEALGLIPAAAHAPPEESGSLRAGRLLRAFALARKRAGEGEDWAEILQALQDVLDGEVEADGLTLESGSERAVRVMNLHQAKGLEAPVVFLADPYPETGSSHSPTHHVRRSENQLVAPITKDTRGGASVTHPPLGWEGDEGFEALEERHEAAEKRRLAYVAATRAERLLVVSEYHHKNDGRKDGDWADLYPHVDDAPVLEERSAPEASGRPAAPDVGAHARRREEAAHSAARPSYKAVTVSEERKAASETRRSFHEDTGGHGRVVGTAVHAYLEGIVQAGPAAARPSLEQAERHLRAAHDAATGGEGAGPSEAVSEGAARTVLKMVSRFVESPLAQSVADAEPVFAEYPVAEATAGDPSTVRRGVIDLVYRDAGGWHVVDYKTDRVPAGGLPESIRDHPYADQVRRYAGIWEGIAGEPVAGAQLWFADAGEAVSVA